MTASLHQWRSVLSLTPAEERPPLVPRQREGKEQSVTKLEARRKSWHDFRHFRNFERPLESLPVGEEGEFSSRRRLAGSLFPPR